MTERWDAGELAAAQEQRLERDLVAITEIPAPTFEEDERAAWLVKRWRQTGAPSVSRDAVGNVRARLPGRHGQRLYVLVAHMDTVFDASIPVKCRRQGERLLAPGSGDNSAGVAVLTSLLEILTGDRIKLDADFMLVASVGEEGLGNLRGARHLVQELASSLSGFVAIDGSLGSLVTTGVGSRRFEVTLKGEGGHSWADYQRPNPAHVLSGIIHDFYQEPRPDQPRTTINVSGLLAPGSVNSIPTTARALFEVRSTDAGPLDKLGDRLKHLVRDRAEAQGLRLTMDEVGYRPAGSTASDHPLVLAVTEAMAGVGLQPAVEAASTDANAAMAAGIPAVSMGIRRGGGAHTLSEYVVIPSLRQGLELALRVVLALDRLPVADGNDSGAGSDEEAS